MDSSNTRVAKVLRDARAEIARPMRPNTPRDPRMMSTTSFSSGGGNNHNTPTTTSNGRFPTNNNNSNIKSSPTTGKLAQSSSSGALPPLPVNNTSARNNNNNNIVPLPPMHPSTSSMSTSTFSASNDISAKRTATAGAGSSSSDGITNSNNNATGSGTFNFFDVKPPPPKKNFNNTISSSNMKTTKENNHNINSNNNNIGSRQQQQQCEDPDQEQERLMPTRLLRKRRNSQLSSAGNSDIAVSESSTADSSSNFGVDENNNNNTTTNVTDPEKYKSLILDLDSEDIRKKGHAAKEILSLLFTWKKKPSSNEEAEEEDEDEEDEIDTEKLRTKALEVALSLFRDNNSCASNNNNSDINASQQQQQQFGWEVAKEVKLVDMALRYAETRPFGSVDFTLAVSCVKTASETPECIQSVFTAGGIPVLKNVLDTAVEKLTTASNNNNNPIITLSVALTLQTLSSLSANYSAQIIKCGVCQPCVDLAPFVEHDDRAAAALCSLAAKLSADDTQAVSIWREIKHGSFASKLARCVTLRWKRMYEKSAKITGSTIVARGLLAIALLIADGSTPLDQVAADNNFVTSLCTEFDEMCATMNPATADEHEELVNALRVISGVSVNSVGGHLLADHPSLKELVTDLLMDLEPDSETGQSVLLLALVCISNFTFYCFQPSDQRNHSNTASDFSSGEEDRDTPIISDSVALLWLENLLPCLLGILFNDGSSPEALVETTRALGNISRTVDGVGACRQHRIDEVVCALLNHEDARIVYNCLGVVTNLSAIAINEGTPKERLPWLPICDEQVTALAEKKCDVSIEYPEVAELAEAARCNIMNI